ncbi:MAG: hypothetical protein AABX23_01885 [Nanoarchaeota archaeon]|mgnify:CR=1 FL=1
MNLIELLEVNLVPLNIGLQFGVGLIAGSILANPDRNYMPTHAPRNFLDKLLLGMGIAYVADISNSVYSIFGVQPVWEDNLSASLAFAMGYAAVEKCKKTYQKMNNLDVR